MRMQERTNDETDQDRTNELHVNENHVNETKALVNREGKHDKTVSRPLGARRVEKDHVRFNAQPTTMNARVIKNHTVIRVCLSRKSEEDET